MKVSRNAVFEVFEGKKGEKKHSRHYGCKDANFCIGSVYVKRPFADEHDALVVAVIAPEELNESEDSN